MMKRKIWKALPILALSVLIFTGCATRVTLEAQRAPNLDTTGIRTIAVRPFDPGLPARAPIADQLTSEANRRIAQTGAFQMVSFTSLQGMSRADIEAHGVDALFSGRVIRYANTVNERTRTRVTRGGQRQQYIVHELVVQVEFEYFFERTRDGSMIGPIRRIGRTSRTREDRNALPDPMTLAHTIVTQQLRNFHRDVAPHTISITRTFESEPRRDLRPLHNVAEQMRRAGDIRGARDAYVAIWVDHRSIAAAVNAAILFEATGDLDDAIYLMEQVFVATGAPRANQKLAALNREQAEIMGLEAMEDARSPMEMVVEHAVGEVERVVTANARLWIHNNATVEQGLINDAIDNMTSGFLSSGFTIVERELLSLIAAEQDLHLDGVISDADFVSIGNMAGANFIVAINMTGSGLARRLQVRVLDIERATVIMQSNTATVWRI